MITPRPGDLTIVFLTINNVPPGWALRQRRRLLAAARGAPIVAISAQPLNWRLPNVRHERQVVPEDLEERTLNVHTQIRRGAELATTRYVAVAEDDCLYPPSHFWSFRPEPDACAYDFSRWCMHSWRRADPFFYHSPVKANSAMVAPRDLLVELLTEPMSRHVFNRLIRNPVVYWSPDPILTFYHEQGNDPLERARRKATTPIKAFQIPYWGRAEQAMGWWWL